MSFKRLKVNQSTNAVVNEFCNILKEYNNEAKIYKSVK